MQPERSANALNNVELLSGDWQRHQQALGAALDQAQLLKTQLDRGHLLSSESVRDRTAVRLLRDSAPHAAAAGQNAPPRHAAAALLDAARLQHAELHADALTALASEVAVLQVTSAALDADEDKLRRRFLPQRQSLAAVIQDDARLAGLSEQQIQAEVRTQAAEGAKRARLLRLRSRIASSRDEHNVGVSAASTPTAGGGGGGSFSSISSWSPSRAGSATQQQQQLRQQQQTSRRRPGYGASRALDTEQSDASGEENEDEEAEYEEEQEESDDQTEEGDTLSTSPQPLSGEASQSEVQPQVAAAMTYPPSGDLPGLLHIIKNQRQCGRRNPVPLDVVATSLTHSLPQQQEQLALLRRVSAYTSARLTAQMARPVHSYAGQLALTPQQRSIGGLAHDIIDSLITSALAHVSMRPSQAVVDLELAEWRVGQPAALAAISRHLADALYKEVVDELLLEVAGEVVTSAAAAEAFSADMLVAAVAFSTGKFDLGFSAAQAPGSGNRGVGGVAREAALLRKVANTKSAAILTGPDAAAAAAAMSSSSSNPAGLRGRVSTTASTAAAVGGGGVGAQGQMGALSGFAGSSESVYLARRDFSALDHAFSSVSGAAQGRSPSAAAVGASAVSGAGGGVSGGGGGSGGGAGGGFSSSTAATSPSRRLARQQSSASSAIKYTRGLYLAGLRGMLAEMRGVRPPGTPYGHTQQLTPHLSQGQARSKATRLAVSRARPPLAACARVWALRQGPLGRLEPGGWATHHHIAAAAKERAFWSKVAVCGYLLAPPPPSGSPTAPPLSSLSVPPALGAISCLSACPSGELLAAGTDRRGLLVWDIRGRGGDGGGEGQGQKQLQKKGDLGAPVMFQVSGTGQVYKRSWWNPWAGDTPQRPAITGLCWSADGFQLAALDASSNLKLWWMAPEQQTQQQQAQQQSDRVPPAPQLAVVVTPFNVALSGKAPIADADDAALRAAQEELGGAAVSGGSSSSSGGSGTRSGLLPKLGQLLGFSQGSGPHDSQTAALTAAAAAGGGGAAAAGGGGVSVGAAAASPSQLPSYQWHPVFHPSRSPAGTQPTIVIPQVTGDVLSLTTCLAEAAVQPGPAPTAQQGSVGAALAAAAAAAASAVSTAGSGGGGDATAAAVNTATGRGQVPPGASLASPTAGHRGSASAAAGGANSSAASGVTSSSATAAAAGGSISRGKSLLRSMRGVGSMKGAADTGDLGSSSSSQQQSHSAAEGVLPEAVVDYLMPPQAANADIDSQALYRCHAAPVVFLGFLSDDASLITLDSSGLLVLWPQQPSQRCGFGWLKPRNRWQLPRMMRTCQLRGAVQTFYPASGASQLPPPPATANTRSRNTANNSTAAGAGLWYAQRYVPDAQDLLDEAQLQQDPAGEFLLRARTPWLVRYLPAGSPAALVSSGAGGVVRQVFHRPPDTAASSSSAASAPPPGSSNCVVVSSYDAATGALLARGKQRCTFARAPVKVVGARLTPSKRELVVLCRLAPQDGGSSDTATTTLTATTISLSSMRAAVPRIDLPDVSWGAAGAGGCAPPPAFELSRSLVTTGSEYLLADLGCGVVGVFSLATAQLVRELRLHSMSPTAGQQQRAGAGGGGGPFAGSTVLGSLQWVQVRGRSASSSSSSSAAAAGGGVGGYKRRTLLAAACVGGQHAALVELDVDAAAQQVRAAQEDAAGQLQQQQRSGSVVTVAAVAGPQRHQAPPSSSLQQPQQPQQQARQQQQQPQQQHGQQYSEQQAAYIQRQQQLRDQQGQQRLGDSSSRVQPAVSKHHQQPGAGNKQQAAAGRKSSVRFQDSHKQPVDNG